MSHATRLIQFLKPYRRWIFIAPLLMTIEVAMDLMQPRMMERIVDQGIAAKDLHVVITTGLLMFALAVIGACGGMSNGIFAEMTSQGFGADLREALFHKVQTFSFANLDELDTGQLITRLTNDVTQIMEAIVMVLRILVRAPLLLIGSLIMGIITCPQLAFIPLVLMPIELVMVLWIINHATPLFTGVQARLDALNEVMQENLSGIRVVKAFVRAEHEKARFGKANVNLTEQTVRANRTVAIMFPFMILTMNAGIIAVLWFGGIQVVEGGMKLGQIIAFSNYLMTTLFSLMMVSQLIVQLARAEASARRIQEVLDKEPSIQDPPGDAIPGLERPSLVNQAIEEQRFSNETSLGNVHPSPVSGLDGVSLRDAERSAACSPGRPAGRVAFENVTFAYNGNGEDPVLKGVTFTAEPGQTVAILGTTGAGKSSLVHLIPRFYDVKSGRVTVDGVDVRDLRQADLRRRIGVALQEVVLFSGTIRDNIRYGRPAASDEEVVAAAKAAQAHDFILSFPEGYDTELGQRGVNLSGGQKQRIAIARALLLQPEILILDDSTSAVDVETESKIQDALEVLMKNRTSFVIAQRISTVLKADKILVLDDGQIAAQGTHRELMQSSPIYREIYESQLGNGVVVNG